MKHENLASILTEEIDEEMLERMPGWFRILREAYEKQKMMEVYGNARLQIMRRMSRLRHFSEYNLVNELSF